MICSHCQEEIPEGNKFCPSCGQRVEETVRNKPSREPPQQSRPVEEETSLRRSGRDRRESASPRRPSYDEYDDDDYDDEVSHSSQQQSLRRTRTAPQPQPVVQKSFNSRLVTIPVAGIVMFFVISVIYTVFFGLDSVAYIKERAAFNSRADVTNEMILDFCSEGTWTEVENDVVRYQGNLYGSQSPIQVEFTIDKNNNNSTEITYFSVDNREVGGTREAKIIYYGYLFTACYKGIDGGKTQADSIDLKDILTFTVLNSNISSNYDITYLKMADFLYSEGTWSITWDTDTSWSLVFVGSNGGAEELSINVNHDTRDASSTIDAFYFLGTELNSDEIDEWVKSADSASSAGSGSLEESVPQIENDSISQEEMFSLYIAEIERYQEGEELHWTVDEFAMAGMAENAPYYGPYAMRVAFFDFDNNGILEMIISGVNDAILGIYTLSRESGSYAPKLLISSGMFSTLEVGNGFCILEREEGAFESFITLYQLQEDVLLEVDASTLWEWYPDFFEYEPMTNYLSYEPTAPESSFTINELDYYKNIIGEYGLFYMFGEEGGAYNKEIVSDVFHWIDFYDFGTCFYDIDGNGVKELLVGSQSQAEVVYDLYTIVIETEHPYVQKIASGGERNYYSMDSNHLIYNIWSNGADDSGVDVYGYYTTELRWENAVSMEDYWEYQNDFIAFPYENIETYVFFP